MTLNVDHGAASLSHTLFIIHLALPPTASTADPRTPCTCPSSCRGCRCHCLRTPYTCSSPCCGAKGSEARSVADYDCPTQAQDRSDAAACCFASSYSVVPCVAPHTTVICRQLANCPPRSSSKNADISSSTTLLFERHSGTRARAPWSERCRRKSAAAHDHLRV
jgi:hypothetical protein